MINSNRSKNIFTRFLKSLLIFTLSSFMLIALTACSDNTSKEISDNSTMQTDISKLKIPRVAEIAGLGEASHGVKEYHQMKAEVFKALVNNSGCRTFIIEGDFGGALRVNEYINGGEGTAEEAVKEIGFAIYDTQELTELVNWMRQYNESAKEEDKLKFYGMDIQRYDNNKKTLFGVLDKSLSEASEKYKIALAQLSDEGRLVISEDILRQSVRDVEELLAVMDESKDQIIETTSQSEFDFAMECAKTISQCSQVLLSSNTEYNQLRDKMMFDKVNWFMDHGDGNLIFINGHNGHISKASGSQYTSLGEQLKDKFGNRYYAIGTDAENTEFNSQKNDGSFEVMEVTNKNDLNGLVNSESGEYYFVDFLKVQSNEEWIEIINEEQKLTTLNVGIASWQKMLKFFYTTSIVPFESYDGMIVFKDVHPTTILE